MNTAFEPPPDAAEFAAEFGALVANVEKVLRGKRDVVTLALICLFAEGHLLLEDVPGVGKTSLARCLAASLDLSCQRIQFTPDLLPSDVTGVTVYNQRTGEFIFNEGPVFTNVLIADEINRASPRTQSALLEVMAEKQVTVDGAPRPVPRPFLVVATQNPLDMDGTYSLPEAQLDRFLIRTRVGYPPYDDEVQVLFDQSTGHTAADLRPAISAARFRVLVKFARCVHVSAELAGYLVRLVAASRESPDLLLGASPRASVALLRAAQVRAAAQSRDYVTPDDVKALAGPVLAHRLLLTDEAEMNQTTAEAVVARLTGTVAVPRMRLPTPRPGSKPTYTLPPEPAVGRHEN
ncbi:MULTISPECIES: MoxR family ATPase [unclassified Pseudofrankia]|uniref:AAA family ATPase n=1 Tax=unclassified Pseudofrankia TaxID=2994372 RepID=UPI00092350D9|nr:MULTISPECIES: MoxR family ATPase [unclassified Pseudofrankia]MDT3443933.1 MoxR family ATPase [Pseudofrankia sp. BMG5.37]OHV68212.1 ATPase [Pseudofrankia sp. BMG5.36]